MFPLRGLLGTSEARVGLNFVLVATGGNTRTHPVSILYLDLTLAKDVFCQLYNITHTEEMQNNTNLFILDIVNIREGGPRQIACGAHCFYAIRVTKKNEPVPKILEA